MPEIKHYEGKKKHQGGKRRPHHEDVAVEAQEADEAEAINTEAQNEGVAAQQTFSEAEEVTVEAVEIVAEAEMISEGAPVFEEEQKDQSSSEEQKIHLEFYGSEMIRQKAPKVMELADTVADEWVKDGQFQGLPLGNPLAQVAAAKALRTAKDVEKKLEEKGVIAMAKMGIELVKSKIEKKNH